MSGTVTVGANDRADNTGDLIITFVDVSGSPAISTDGSRTALPGSPWGCYLVAPSISAQPGCVVTLTPPATAAQWESCSLIWQPPPHAATYWTSGGSFGGSAGTAGTPKWPPQAFPASSEVDAAASVSGRTRVIAAAGAAVGATAGISARPVVRQAMAVQTGAAAGVSGDVRGPGASIWPMAGEVDAAAGHSSRARVRARLNAEVDAAAGISGDLQLANQTYALTGTFAGAAGISGDGRIGHQYAVVAIRNATASVVPFGGQAPLRVTNYITNPRPEGIVTGTVTPGTEPVPRWYFFPDSDLTKTIIGSGTENQTPYIDIQFSNPASGGGSLTLQTEDFLLANPGGVWSYSMFLRVVGGSLANISQISLQFLSGDPNGNLLGVYTSAAITPTATVFPANYFSYNGVTISDSGMNNIAPGLMINNNAGAVNVTMRIAAPKAELKTTATGAQYLVVPQVGFRPGDGGSTSFVY